MKPTLVQKTDLAAIFFQKSVHQLPDEPPGHFAVLPFMAFQINL
jgi:hypothetical protein